MTHAVTNRAIGHAVHAASKTVDPRHKDLTVQAQKWVAQTFYGTLLKQMRESPFKNEQLSGGRGGQVFAEMFDQRIAEHMARSSGSKLVNSLVKKMEGAAAYRTQSRKSKNASSARDASATLQSQRVMPVSSFSGRA